MMKSIMELDKEASVDEREEFKSRISSAQMLTAYDEYLNAIDNEGLEFEDISEQEFISWYQMWRLEKIGTVNDDTTLQGKLNEIN